MRYPMLEGKHEHESVVPLPAGPYPPGAPEVAILCYPRWLVRELASAGEAPLYPWDCRGEVYLLDERVAVVGGMGVGGPAAAMLVEELGCGSS